MQTPRGHGHFPSRTINKRRAASVGAFGIPQCRQLCRPQWPASPGAWCGYRRFHHHRLGSLPYLMLVRALSFNRKKATAQAQPTATVAATWFVADAEQAEPVEISAETLQTLDPDTLVWTDGLPDWVAVHTVAKPMPRQPIVPMQPQMLSSGMRPTSSGMRPLAPGPGPQRAYAPGMQPLPPGAPRAPPPGAPRAPPPGAPRAPPPGGPRAPPPGLRAPNGASPPPGGRPLHMGPPMAPGMGPPPTRNLPRADGGDARFLG